MFYGLQISKYLQSTQLFANTTIGSPYYIGMVCVCVCYVDDIYLLICNLILNLAVVLGTIFVHKPLISSEPIEAADPDLKAPVEMTPKSPTIHDPDQFHPAPSCTTYVHTAHNNATSDCLPLFLNKPFLTGFV